MRQSFRSALLGCFSAIVLVVLGCQRLSGAHDSQIRISVAVPSPETDLFWEAAQDSLRWHGFRLDRVDRRAGVITTLPEVSKHYFEFWRRDVATGRDLLESTVNPIRRRVEVGLAPTSGTGAGFEAAVASDLTIAVYKERLSGPDRQFNSAGAAYQFFGESLPSTTGAVLVSAENDRWLDAGRDAAMEARILDDVRERVATVSPKDSE